MLRSLWLRQLSRALFGRSSSSRKYRRHVRTRTRPSLESLEDRTLLNNPVSTTAGLIAAINSANNAGGSTTITLASGTTFDFTAANNTTNGANALPVIGAHITIVGNGDTISGGGVARLFDVAGGLNLQNLTLSGGLVESTLAAHGGAIYSSGTLNLQGVTVKNNDAAGIHRSNDTGLNGANAFGGGLYVAGGSVNLSNDTFSSNIAQGISGTTTGGGPVRGVGNAYGGGLYVASGTLTLTNDTFNGNAALHGGHYVPGGSGYGGAIDVGGRMTVRSCTFSDNSATNAGGGIYYGGGTLTLEDSTFKGNGASYGGGVALDASAALSGCTFDDNGAVDGGGIANSGTSTVSNCTFVDNGATYGGGIRNTDNLTVSSCTLMDNGATYGGGIDNSAGDQASLGNTIVAGSPSGSDLYGSFGGSYDLIGDGSGDLSPQHNLLGSSTKPLDPLLAPLGNYGGPTETMALLPGSIAIGAGDGALSTTTDQRGFIRGSSVDIGAYQTHASIVVNTTGDTTGTVPSGVISLREAISWANEAVGGITAIDFSIGATGSAQTINISSQLPALTANGVYINGLSQGGSSNTTQLITLNGSGAGSSSDGLLLQGSNCTVSGLIIEDFFNNGIEVDDSNNTIGGTATGAGNVISGNAQDGILIDASGVQVEGNLIGTDVTGSKSVGNRDGIDVDGSNNTIGGTATGAGNVISCSTFIGVSMNRASDVQVQGNYIGTNLAGTGALGNGEGVQISGGSDNTIGGTTAAARNIISGNYNEGIWLIFGASDVQVQGNYIGTNLAGTGALGNEEGVDISGGSDNTIGGTTAAARNIISGNIEGVDIEGYASAVQVLGNYIGTDATGTKAVPNYDGIEIDVSNNTIGGTATGARNIISGNLNNGVDINGSSVTGNVVEGDYIGTNAAGTASLAVGSATPWSAGVMIENGASNNRIGTNGDGANDAAEGNLISGNVGDGVAILDSGSNNNVVAGNLIGTDVTGTKAVANEWDGVLITYGAQYNRFGANGADVDAAGERNVISGNAENGVEIGRTGTNYNWVAGNYIGTNSAGTAAVANGGNGGVWIWAGAQYNTIGTNGDGVGDAAERNIISGSGWDGVQIVNAGTSYNVVAGNYIGTDYTGSIAVSNNLSASGVAIYDGASNNRIGTSGAEADNAGERNVISGDGYGVYINMTGTTGNLVAGNYIGTNAADSVALSNAHDGIFIGSGAQNNTIGGSAAAADNLIANNGGDGVLVGGTDDYVQNNTYQANVNYALELDAGGQAYVTGTVAGSVNDNGTIDMDGSNLTGGALYGTGIVTNSGAAATFTVTGGGSFGGSITGANTALTVAGTSQALVLWGNSSYAGQTTIDATDTLLVGRGNGSASLGTGSVLDSGLLEFNLSNAAVFAENVSGAGGLTQAGVGTLTLTGTNNYSGATTINAGMTLQAGNATALSVSSSVNDLGTLNLDGFNSSIGALSGNGAVTNDQVTVYQIDNGATQSNGEVYYFNNSLVTEAEDNWVGNVFTAATGGTPLSSISFAIYDTLDASTLPSPYVTAAIYTGSPATGLTLVPGSTNTVPLNATGGTYSAAEGFFYQLITVPFATPQTLTAGQVFTAALLIDDVPGNVYPFIATNIGTNTNSYYDMTNPPGTVNAYNLAAPNTPTLNGLPFPGTNTAVNFDATTMLRVNSVAAASAATLTVTGGGSFSGSITGSNLGLTVGGGGQTLTLSGNNRYGGTTTINSGDTLQAGSVSAFSANSVVNDVGTLDLAGFNNSIAALNGAGAVINSISATTATLPSPAASSPASLALALAP